VTATAGGTLGPSQQTEVTISVSRNGLIEGDYEATVSVLGAGKAIPVAVRWRVDRAPVVHVTLDPPGLADAATCPATAKDLTGTVSASVIDESSVASVVMTWSGPGHGDSSPMTAGDPGTWSAPVGPLVGPGSWTVVITATDARGNSGSGGTTFVVTACPTSRRPDGLERRVTRRRLPLMYPGPDDRCASPTLVPGEAPRRRPGVYTSTSKALVDLGHHVDVLGGQPYPVLDERVQLTKLPSLDIFNDHYPGRFPAYWEIRHLGDVVEILQFSTGTFSEPLAFSVRAWQDLKRRPRDFRSSTTRASATACWPSSAFCRPSSPLHHPITVDRRLEMEHALTRRSESASAAGTPSSRCRPGSPGRCPASSS
jgi:hypothetical protein